jgi:arylsulfatase A-like enzyme
VAAALAAAFIAALVLVLLGPADRSLAARPNFVVIQTDDQSAATVRARMKGETGGFRKVMPNAVRQLLGRGTEFTNYYASSPVCSPSRASLLSGQYPWNSGIESNEGPNGGWEGWQNHGVYRRNLATTLNDAGYRTAHIGKFTNGYFDRARGQVETRVPPGWTTWFTPSYVRGTHYYGYRLNRNGVATGPIGDPDYRQNGPGIDPATCSPRRLQEIWPLGRCTYSSDVYTATAIREIRADRSRPFYIHLSYQASHGDVAGPRGPQPATRHIGAASRTPLPRPRSFNERDLSDKPALIQSLTSSPLNRGQIGRLRQSFRRYIESLRSADDGIGAIFRALRGAGELRNTYVFLLSDHGLFLGEHRYDWGKFLPYEASSSPLMAVRGPGVRGGESSGEVVGNVDVPVTIMRLAGATPDYGVDGRSLRGFWRDTDSRSRRPMPIVIDSEQVPEAASVSARSPALRYRGYRVGPYKYIRYDRGGEELYDLSKDPDELENRVDSPGYAEVLTYMRSHLNEVTGCQAAGCRAELPALPAP